MLVWREVLNPESELAPEARVPATCKTFEVFPGLQMPLAETMKAESFEVSCRAGRRPLSRSANQCLFRMGSDLEWPLHS